MPFKLPGISFSSSGALAAPLMFALWSCCPGAHQTAQPPPPTPQPCPVAAAPVPAPPPPPPKCESLEEKCTAATDTRLAVGEQRASFVPPASWIYAKEPEQSIVVSPDAKGWLTFSEAKSEASKDLLGTLERLVTRLGVDKVRTNLLTDRIKRPQHELENGALVTKLWEIDKKSQFGTEPALKGQPGTLLLAVVPLSNTVLVGTAFVTTDMGDTYAKLVMAAVQSLTPLDGGTPPAQTSTEKGAGQ